MRDLIHQPLDVHENAYFGSRLICHLDSNGAPALAHGAVVAGQPAPAGTRASSGLPDASSSSLRARVWSKRRAALAACCAASATASATVASDSSCCARRPGQAIARRSWSSAACAVNRITPSRRRHGFGWSRPRRRVRMRRHGFCGRFGADRHPCLTGVQRVAILPGNFAGALHVP